MSQVYLTEWPASLKDLRWDNLVTSPSNNGNGFAIINNTVGNLRSVSKFLPQILC